MPLEELYVIPLSCPREKPMVQSNAWGELGAVRLRLLSAIHPLKSYPHELEVIIREKLFLTWTCAGCTVGLGNEEHPCPQRRCDLGGGRELKRVGP